MRGGDSAAEAPGNYRFGPFRLDPRRRRLFRDGTLVALMPKVVDLLCALVERPGELRSKDDLLEALWPGIAVEENNLTHAMAKLRRALGDNIREPQYIVTVSGQGYRFVARVGTSAPDADSPPASHEQPRRVSRVLVLPFRILRPDPDSDFLAFSLPDAITSSLCGFESLTVRSSAVAARFVNDPPDFAAIAAIADVDAVLHATLLQGGEEVRVSAQLVRVPDGTVLWSGTAQARRGDVFHLQDTLARRIVDGLAVRLTSRDERLLRHDVPTSGRAYEWYLRANQLGRDPRQLEAARDLYLQAVEVDPTYAPAWAGLGRIHRVIGKYRGLGTPESTVLAESALKRSLELNPDLGLAHGLYTYIEADAGRALDAMKRLLRQPGTRSDSELLAGLVQACRYCGLLDESVAAHACARRLDPIVRTSVPQTLWARGDFEAALRENADSPANVAVTILSVEALGRVSEAIALADDAIRSGMPPAGVAFISGFRAAFEGNRPAGLAAARECMRTPPVDPEAAYRMAWLVARLGDDELALDTMRRSLDGGFWCPSHMAADPWFERLRGTVAFSDLLSIARARQSEARAAFVALGGDELLQLA